MVSPTIILISVLLPAPFGPTQAMRDAIEHCAETLFSVYFSRVGYLKLAPVSLRIALVADLTPSSGPGSGSENFCVDCVRSKYDLASGFFSTKRSSVPG